MLPEVSALLVPMLDAEPLVGRWRRLLDPAAAQGVPAHITLLYPFLAPAALDAATEAALAILLRTHPAFALELARTRRLDGLLMLEPEPAAPLEAIRADLIARWPLVPYGGRYGASPPMHLSLAYGPSADPARWGEIEADLAPHLPLPTRAAECWLVVRRQDRWRLRRSFKLGG